MIDCSLQRAELIDRLGSVRTMLAATHGPAILSPNISREIRGVSIVLIYAAYENLLTSLCRLLLETAAQLRAGNKRLRPGLKVFATFNHLQAATAASQAKIWRDTGLEIVATMTHSSDCTVNANVFPTDGSHMKRGQIVTFCRLFELGEPGPILREVWDGLDTIVTQRNALAHGQATAAEIGRRYTHADLESLIDSWELRWNQFLDWVETRAATRAFFLLPR
jgi:hypothetical protein